MLFSMTGCYIQCYRKWGRIYIRVCTHIRHPITRPFLLWRFGRNLTSICHDIWDAMLNLVFREWKVIKTYVGLTSVPNMMVLTWENEPRKTKIYQHIKQRAVHIFMRHRNSIIDFVRNFGSISVIATLENNPREIMDLGALKVIFGEKFENA